MIVLDTNVVSAAMAGDTGILQWLDHQSRELVWTTTLTVLEIRFGLAIMPAGRKLSAREAAFDRLLTEKLDRRVLSFDENAAMQTAFLMAARQRAGKPRELRDSMIAGIVLAHRATVATRNARHFDDLQVPVVNPWQT